MYLNNIFFLCYYKIMKKKYMLVSLFIILLVFADQISKVLITNNIELYGKVNIIPNFFNLTYTKNFGAAFGILEGKRVFFLIITILVFGYLIYELIKNIYKKLYSCSLILIISGIIGNFIDRLLFGFVRDFLDFKIFGYDAAIFNLADSFIVIGVIIFLISIILEEKNESKR